MCDAEHRMYMPHIQVEDSPSMYVIIFKPESAFC